MVVLLAWPLLRDYARNTITKGPNEVKSLKVLPSDKIRKDGGGRKRLAVAENKIIEDIEKILNETTAGDPMSSIRWTCKSVRNIEELLLKNGHRISYW